MIVAPSAALLVVEPSWFLPSRACGTRIGAKGPGAESLGESSTFSLEYFSHTCVFFGTVVRNVKVLGKYKNKCREGAMAFGRAVPSLRSGAGRPGVCFGPGSLPSSGPQTCQSPSSPLSSGLEMLSVACGGSWLCL